MKVEAYKPRWDPWVAFAGLPEVEKAWCISIILAQGSAAWPTGAASRSCSYYNENVLQ